MTIIKLKLNTFTIAFYGSLLNRVGAHTFDALKDATELHAIV